jgi:hypothetical protein
MYLLEKYCKHALTLQRKHLFAITEGERDLEEESSFCCEVCSLPSKRVSTEIANGGATRRKESTKYSLRDATLPIWACRSMPDVMNSRFSDALREVVSKPRLITSRRKRYVASNRWRTSELAHKRPVTGLIQTHIVILVVSAAICCAFDVACLCEPPTIYKPLNFEVLPVRT